MNSLSFVRVLRIATVGFLLISCLISCGVDRDEACPGVRLEYRYNRENTSGENLLSQYVRTI
ncbi:MAG: hypothetical protein LBR26_09025, partial [Prevotella sp.]|nr:hypothetical protein [Prevotella sp.]